MEPPCAQWGSGADPQKHHCNATLAETPWVKAQAAARAAAGPAWGQPASQPAGPVPVTLGQALAASSAQASVLGALRDEQGAAPAERKFVPHTAVGAAFACGACIWH